MKISLLKPGAVHEMETFIFLRNDPIHKPLGKAGEG